MCFWFFMSRMKQMQTPQNNKVKSLEWNTYKYSPSFCAMTVTNNLRVY